MLMLLDLGATLWGPLTYINSFKTYEYPVWYYIPGCLDGDTDIWEII